MNITSPISSPVEFGIAKFDAQEVVANRLQQLQKTRRRGLIIDQLLRILLIVGFFAVWQYFAMRSTPLLLPEPLDVWRATWPRRGYIMDQAWFTLQEAFLGAIYGGVVGFALGVLIGHSRRAETVLSPFIVASQAVPKVALAPLFVVWLGFGMAPKIAIAALIAFFPLLENTVVGLRNVDTTYVKLFRASGANAWQAFWKLRLMSALPFILTGARISLLYSLLGAIVGEFIAGNKGVGAAIVQAQGIFKTDLMYGLIATLTLIGLSFYLVARMLERLVLHRLHISAAATTDLKM